MYSVRSSRRERSSHALLPELREQTPGWRKILRGLRDPGDTEHSLAGILQFRQAGKFCANTAEFCAGITEWEPIPQNASPRYGTSEPAPQNASPRYGTSEPAPRSTSPAPAPAPKSAAKRNTAPIPPNAATLDPRAGRLIKGLICVPVAAALVYGIVWFFEIDVSNMQGYVNIVANKIRDLDVFVEAAPLLAAVAVYGLAVMIVLSAYMLPARLSKTIYKTCTVADKIWVTVAGYFVIALSIYLKTQIIDTGITGRTISLLFRVHGTDRLKMLFALLITLFCIVIALAFIIGSSAILLSVVVNNLAVNGPILGIIAAVYELLSSVFVTALVLCAFSFGVAIIMMPFLILAACSSGSRVVYDEYGNRYYVVD